MRKTILLFLFFILVHLGLEAQQKSDSQKAYKNTIRFNITNPLLFGGKSLIFGYERILGKYSSFSINIGQASFPSLSFLGSDSLRADKKVGEKGYHLSADYRFYLSKQNKFPAPHGVYIGPYYSYNYFESKHAWSILSSNGGNAQNVETTTSLLINGIGIQMGYQFVWKRISLDMILAGPGIAFYNLKAAIGSNLPEADKQKFFEELNQALADKFPGYSIVIDEDEFQKQGTVSKTDLGFRYMIMIGFRF